MCYLGRDRVYRSYFYVHHLRMLLVECPAEDEVPPCDRPTPIRRSEEVPNPCQSHGYAYVRTVSSVAWTMMTRRSRRTRPRTTPQNGHGDPVAQEIQTAAWHTTFRTATRSGRP